jgi:heme A synthase
LFALAASIRTMSYTFYTAAIAGAVLIAADVPHPSNLTDEGRRILFTLAGVGIAIIVLLLAGLLQKRTAAKATPEAPPHPAQVA